MDGTMEILLPVSITVKTCIHLRVLRLVQDLHDQSRTRYIFVTIISKVLQAVAVTEDYRDLATTGRHLSRVIRRYLPGS